MSLGPKPGAAEIALARWGVRFWRQGDHECLLWGVFCMSSCRGPHCILCGSFRCVVKPSTGGIVEAGTQIWALQSCETWGDYSRWWGGSLLGPRLVAV